MLLTLKNAVFYLIMWSSNLTMDVLKAVTNRAARVFNHISSARAVALDLAIKLLMEFLVCYSTLFLHSSLIDGFT